MPTYYINAPLLAASRDGDSEKVKAILATGASPNAGTTSLCPLTESIENDHALVVKILLQHGADDSDIIPYSGDLRPNVRPIENCLHYAAMVGSVGVIRMLLVMGANVNSPDQIGRTALCRAAEAGITSSVRALLAGGARVDFPDRQGRTSLFWAAAEDHANVVTVLLQAGADVESGRATSRDATTPLLYAAGAGFHEVVDVLLANDADKDHLDRHRRSALTRAVLKEHTVVVKVLIAWKVDLHQVDSSGLSALGHARWMRNRDIVELLENAGAKR
ncbi:ankyrin repeat-containing domain protein [Aspergillus californicus]